MSFCPHTCSLIYIKHFLCLAHYPTKNDPFLSWQAGTTVVCTQTSTSTPVATTRVTWEERPRTHRGQFAALTEANRGPGRMRVQVWVFFWMSSKGVLNFILSIIAWQAPGPILRVVGLRVQGSQHGGGRTSPDCTGSDPQGTNSTFAREQVKNVVRAVRDLLPADCLPGSAGKNFAWVGRGGGSGRLVPWSPWFHWSSFTSLIACDDFNAWGSMNHK